MCCTPAEEHHRGVVWCFSEHVLCTTLPALRLHHPQTPLLGLEAFSSCAGRFMFCFHLEASSSVSCPPLLWLLYSSVVFCWGIAHVTHHFALCFLVVFSSCFNPPLRTGSSTRAVPSRIWPRSNVPRSTSYGHPGPQPVGVVVNKGWSELQHVLDAVITN